MDKYKYIITGRYENDGNGTFVRGFEKRQTPEQLNKLLRKLWHVGDCDRGTLVYIVSIVEVWIETPLFLNESTDGFYTNDIALKSLHLSEFHGVDFSFEVSPWVVQCSHCSKKVPEGEFHNELDCCDECFVDIGGYCTECNNDFSKDDLHGDLHDVMNDTEKIFTKDDWLCEDCIDDRNDKHQKGELLSLSDKQRGVR